MFIFNINATDEMIYFYVYTPNGSQIKIKIEEDEGNLEYFWYWDFYRFFEIYGYNESLVTILAPATNTYTCQDFAWIISDGGPVCIFASVDDIPKFWEDGSYEETTEANADKVYYEGAGHAAVKSILYQGMYVSKWGFGPLVRHPYNLTPYEYSSDGLIKKTYYRLKCPSEIKDKTFTTTDVNIRTRCDTIKVSNTIIEAGANVTVTSNSQITLLPGFQAKAGSTFYAKIEPIDFDVDNPVLPATPAPMPSLQRTFFAPVVNDDITLLEEVKMANTTQKIAIYPNPASNWIVVKTSNPEKLQYIEIHNLNGTPLKRLSNVANSEETKINISNLPAGIYFVVVSGIDILQNFKFVKE